jgi:hypothetical protein
MKVVIFSSSLLLFCSPAFALEQPKLNLLLNSGVVVPTAPETFNEAWRKGVNLGGGVGYRWTSHFSLYARFNYDQFPLNEQGLFDLASKEVGYDPRSFGLSPNIQGGDGSILSVSGELKVSFFGDSGKISPYVIGGLGVAHYVTDDATFSVSFLGFDLILETIVGGESETAASAIFGGGVDVPLNGRFGIFVEGRYQVGFTEDEATNHGTIGAGLRIGLR